MNISIAVLVSLALAIQLRCVDSEKKISMKPKSADIRLADSGLAEEGRLEVFHDGAWGTVCNHNFDDLDASIACSHMFGPSYLGQVIGSQYGEGSGPIWMDEVNCAGTEASLDQCSHSGWGIHNCQHSDDVSISCTYMNASACPDELGFTYFAIPKLCYAADTTVVSWSGAALYCQSLHPDAHLIVIDDETEQTALNNFASVLPTCSDYWTAGQRLDNAYQGWSCGSEYAWKRVDFRHNPAASPMTYTNWYSGEPGCDCANRFNYDVDCESCMFMRTGDSYQWFSTYCVYYDLCPFCEIDIL